MIIAAVTLSGPILAGLAIWLDTQWLFWIGVALAAFNLFMDIVSGATKFPILEISFIIIGAILWEFWWIGSALGLLLITAIDGLLILTGRRRRGA